MKLFKLTRRFSQDDSGAVTVDWVVLAAAIVALASGVVLIVGDGVDELAGNISDALGGIAVTTGRDAPAAPAN